jgi:FixJ family two-component response regulator
MMTINFEILEKIIHEKTQEYLAECQGENASRLNEIKASNKLGVISEFVICLYDEVKEGNSDLADAVWNLKTGADDFISKYYEKYYG